MSRRAAAVSVRVAAVIVAGAVALPTLRRRLHASSGRGTDESGRGDSSSAAAGILNAQPGGSASGLVDDGQVDNQAVIDDPGQVERDGVPAPIGDGGAGDHGTDSGPGSIQSSGADDSIALKPGRPPSSVMGAKTSVRRHLTAAWAYTRPGFTSAVWVLLVLTVATATYGWVKHPNTAVPQPPSSSIEVDFSPDHPALSPITVGVLLQRDASPNGGGSLVTLYIDLTGADFAHAGWWVFADVPPGVNTDKALDNYPSHTAGGTDYVYIAPGPQPGGRYEAQIEWKDPTSGPVQVIGANLVAVFPTVTVINATANDSASVPTPPVTVNRALLPGSDFTYQAGSQPDRFVGLEWQWNPVMGNVQDPDLADSFTVEAKSASADGLDQTAQLYSGIAFGVAASAFIALVVEFVNADRRKTPTETRPAIGADEILAGDDPDRTGELRPPQGVGA